MDNKQTYIALLRGINVGGHHKVPMADLRREMGEMGFENVITLLNSGNVIFDDTLKPEAALEEKIAPRLEAVFGFPVPVLIRKDDEIIELINRNPFKDIEATKDIRLYVTFLREMPDHALTFPWVSEDESYRIIDIKDKTICSVLDLSLTKTIKVMGTLEQHFGKDSTTRNWNTVNRIAEKLN